MTPKKPCKKCSKPRYANLNICFSHYKAREKEKREEKKEKALIRKQSTKKWQDSRRKTLNNKAWKLMSEWVRRKDSDWRGYNNCFTCGKKLHWKELQAGHFIHGKLDYDDRNLKPQCGRPCNLDLSGNLRIYSRKLIGEYGLDWLDKLELDANTHMGYTIPELEKRIVELESLLKELNEK